MTPIARNVRHMLLFPAIMLLPLACSLIRPAPEVAEAPLAVQFSDAELRRIILPQHLPPARLLPSPPEPQSKYFVHTIRHAGETLIAIARWYTGNGENWKKLAQVNQGLVPQRINIGDAIRIPEEMLITRKPLPKIARSARRTDKKPAPAPSPPANPVEEPQLFGPVGISPPDTEVDTGLPRALQTLDETN